MTKILFIPTILLAILFSCASYGGETSGQFSNHADIGEVKQAGSVKYNSESQDYIISGSGKNMWYGEDELHFLWNKMKGDFIVRARMNFLGKGVDPHRKIGWNVRKTLASNSPNIHATVHGDGLSSLQFRRTPGGETEQHILNITNTEVIQLERRGSTYIMSAAKHGEEFQVTQVSHIDLGEELYVGLTTCAHNANVMERARFSNVRIIVPAKEDFRPYEDYIGSNLEIMEMESKNRRIVYRDPDSIQAPNWTHDGKTLIYNSKGLLYNFDIESKTPSVLNSGFATDNNNDHVISFDGKTMAISHHNAEDERKSTIYTMPISGSDNPKQITQTGIGHSFLHSFSPDDKNILFTANRKNKWDIYSINRETRKETQLTDTPTLDDGSEFSANGKFIYFNSNRTGTMQLWRMNPDGSSPQQLTFDSYNDWFPHFSPDGKKIVFLSYRDDIESGDHPFYRHVYLREMPVEGGEPKIIAYIYGGQGTINVPSWSPDGKFIAFVSNTSL